MATRWQPDRVWTRPNRERRDLGHGCCGNQSAPSLAARTKRLFSGLVSRWQEDRIQLICRWDVPDLRRERGRDRHGRCEPQLRFVSSAPRMDLQHRARVRGYAFAAVPRIAKLRIRSGELLVASDHTDGIRAAARVPLAPTARCVDPAAWSEWSSDGCGQRSDVFVAVDSSDGRAGRHGPGMARNANRIRESVLHIRIYA